MAHNAEQLPERIENIVDKDFLTKIDEKIQAIKKAALDLKEISGGIQAIDRNTDRILASTKMLEINVSEVLEIWE